MHFWSTLELKACIRVCMLQLSALNGRENQVFWSDTRARIVFFTPPPSPQRSDASRDKERRLYETTVEPL